MLPAEPGQEAYDAPVMAPLRPAIAQDASNLFHLLAPVEDQMRGLVDELAAEIGHPMQLIVVGPDGITADAVTDQARRRGATVLRRAHVDNLAALLPPAPAESPDAIVVLSDVDFGRLAAARLADQPGSFLLAGAAEAVAPEIATDERLRLVLPIGPGGAPASAVPPLVSAAVAVLAEGLKRMGGASAGRANDRDRKPARFPHRCLAATQFRSGTACRQSRQHRSSAGPQPRHDDARWLAHAAMTTMAYRSTCTAIAPARKAVTFVCLGLR